MLYERQFLSKDELDKDEVAFIEAESKRETSRLAQEVYEEFTYTKDLKQKTSDVEEARAELARVQRKNDSELASKEAQLTNRRRQAQLREDRVTKLREQLAACTITAPTDGLVVYATSLNQNMWGNDSGPYEVGSEIRPNQEIIALPDTTEMVATVRIPEAMLSRVRASQRAVVTIDAAQGKTYTGVVDTIGVMAQSAGWRDPNVREYEVRIALDLGSEPHKLKPSMRCEARIILDSVKDALCVPIQAVFNEGRRQFAYVIEGDMYAQTMVQVGRRSDSFAEIVSGLTEGQTVLMREPPPGRIIKLPEIAKDAAAPGGPPGARPAGRRGPDQSSAAPKADGAKDAVKDASPAATEKSDATADAADEDLTEAGADDEDLSGLDEAEGETLDDSGG
jgi:multidrug efflux pump subunit AcrA (membrane-fusion protein)